MFNIKKEKIINFDNKTFDELKNALDKRIKIFNIDLSKRIEPFEIKSECGYFGLFKRGMKGIYQHCKSQHLKRYLCEFDFRYNRRDLNDVNRAVEIVANAFGKRLKYKEVLVA